MGVKEVKYREYTCDKCGDTSTSEFVNYGYCFLTMKLGFVMYDGATGGNEESKFLCGTCAEKLRAWLDDPDMVD